MVPYLLKLEWLKNKKNSVFLSVIAFYIIILPGGMLIGKQIKNVPPPLPGNSIFFEFPTNWDFFAYAGSWLAFFVFGFFGVYTITSEISFKTLRQSIINGLFRHQFISAKFLFVFVLSIFATLYFVLCVVIFGYLHSTEALSLIDVFDQPLIILKYLIMTMSYFSFGILVGLILKRSGLALISYLIFIIHLEPLFRWVVHNKFISKTSHIYYPMNVLEDLCPLPYFRMIPDSAKPNQFLVPLVEDPTVMFLACFYLLIYILISYRIILRRDL